MIAIFLFGFGRRIQFVIGRFKRLCYITVKRFQHSFTTLCKVCIIGNDRVHRLTHHRKDKVSFRNTSVHFLFTDAESVPTA